MDPSTYQQMMVQALMGGAAQSGVTPNAQNPVTPYGQAAITGRPTVPGGMLGANPYQSINPNAPAGMPPMGAQNPNQLQQPFAQYPGMQGGGGAESR